MSKLTQIEKALLNQDGAASQRLCDAYLKRRGYDRINPIGLVAGTDKVKQGTPDTLFAQPDGKYVFAEYSTQQKGLAKKFGGDLAKCFDESKTGVPVDQICEVILCHNSRLTPKEEHKLAGQCQKHGVRLSVYGLGTLAHDLYDKFSGLAEDFLNIEVDTRQILQTEDLIAYYNKSALATPLDTTFRFREDEINRALAMLKAEDLILISGRPGVGKSRLALEACRRFGEDHPGIKVRCIIHRGPDIFRDLRVHLSEPGYYLVLVDDANRVNHFEYVLQFLREQREDRKIKIIATVRDYALDKAREIARPFGGGGSLELTRLSDEQLKTFVQEEFGVNYHLYLERIAEIAKGNPRIAVMAARIALRENTLASIADVSALYDEYFSSIRSDIEDLQDATLLRVAGIIAFFRAVDRSNAELMKSIGDVFGIDEKVFWRAAERLHLLEAVDMYENEVVRVSDQVLATYLFYLCFIKERVIEFGVLLEHLFPDLRYRSVDALNSVLEAFNFRAIADALRPHVARARSAAQEQGDDEKLRHLLDVFCFVNPTDSLVYVKDRIKATATEPRPVAEMKFTAGSEVPDPASVLSILDDFRHASDSDRRVAITLIVDYLERCPAKLPLILRTLTERYGMKHYSHHWGFAVERDVVDVLWERAQDGANELVSRVFLAVAEPLLHTHFQTHESKGHNSINVIQFDVPVSRNLLELRRVIWQRVFALSTTPQLRNPVLELLSKHSRSGYLVANREIIEHDSQLVQPFFQAELNPGSLSHCLLVHEYLDRTEKLGVETDVKLKDRFTNETYKLYEFLSDDLFERRDLGWEEYQKIKRERLAAHTAGFNEHDFQTFFEKCAEILQASDRGRHDYQIQNSVREVLFSLAERDPALYAAVLDSHLQKGDVFELGPWLLVAALITAAGPERAYEILSRSRSPSRTSWLFAYFIALPAEFVSRERLEQMYALYESAEVKDALRDLDYLLKFAGTDENVVVRVTRSLVDKADADPSFGRAFGGVFNEHSQVGKQLRTIFADDVALLKRACFAACAADPHAANDGIGFNALLNLDADFAGQWVSWMFSQKQYLSRHDDQRDYAFLWRRTDCEAVIERISDTILKEQQEHLSLDPYLSTFFVLTEGTEDAETIYHRQDEYVDRIISRKHSDREHMQMIFSVVTSFAPERRRGRIAAFLACNQNVDDFDTLPLEPSSWGWSGSAVPMYQRRVDFFESLLPLVNTSELLFHKQSVERQIEALRNSIEREKKRDFISE